MQEILDAFGIDWRLITIQIVNFALLVVVLSYFLYKPVLTILKEREQKIAKGVKDAEDAGTALKQADSEKAKIITEAHTNAGEIVERAKVHADDKGSKIVKDAEEKASRITEEAKLRGEELKAQAREESEGEIAKVAILTAEKILNEKLN